MIFKKYILITIIYICFIVNSESAKILAVFPIPSISHQVVFRPLIHELAKRGHEVIVITPDPAFPKGKTPGNLTEIDVHDISYKLWQNTFMKISNGKQTDLVTQLSIAFDVILDVFKKQLQIEDVKDVIFSEKNKYDLIFTEACVRPALALSHIIKAPLIQVSSFGSFFGMYEYMGAPLHPLLYPSTTRQKIYNLTITEKISELYTDFYLQYDYKKKEKRENDELRNYFGKDMPDLIQLSNNVQMLFLNINPIFEGNRPVPPSVVYMGGIHKKIDKKLPKDLETFIDKAKHGVIYVSFGTNVDPLLLPKEKIQDMILVLSKLPYQVLWKWNEDVLPGKTENIKISKWFPQSDLLKHPNVKLFITQGGLQSTDEAIEAGVPLIGIPILGDQWYNVEKYVHHGIGIRLDIENLSREKLQTSIDTIISDKRYKQNIMKLRSLMQDQIQTPLDRVVWWTEHVIRHRGAKHLRSPSANITWWEYLELELVFILMTILTVITCLIFFTIKIMLIKLSVIKKHKKE